jgi:hypothetical protein
MGSGRKIPPPGSRVEIDQRREERRRGKDRRGATRWDPRAQERRGEKDRRQPVRIH